MDETPVPRGRGADGAQARTARNQPRAHARPHRRCGRGQALVSLSSPNALSQVTASLRAKKGWRMPSLSIARP